MTHPIVSHEEWLKARKQHLAKEKEFTRLRDPITTSCEDGTPSLDRWRIGSKFVSRWRAPPEQ